MMTGSAKNISLCLVWLALLSSGCEGSEVVAEIEPNDDSAKASSDNGEEPLVIDTDTSLESAECGGVVAIGRDTFFVNGRRDLAALDGVQQVRGSLMIGDFDAEEVDISSLKNLRCVEGDLFIYDVRNLSNLDVFSNLKRVKSDLTIIYNDDLVDVAGLGNLTSLGGNELFIHNNPDLPNCTAKQVYSTMLNLGWDGRTCIMNNSPDGCRNITGGCGSNDTIMNW